jgi:hypothetical protein
MGANFTHTASYLGNPGAAWNVAAIGDYTGDGKADILLRNAANGGVYLWALNGGTVTSQHDLGSAGANWHVVA